MAGLTAKTLSIDVSGCGFPEATSVLIVLRRATSADSFSVVPTDFKVTIDLSVTSTAKLIASTYGSVYEISLFDQSRKVLSRFFIEMPDADALLSGLVKLTSWPSDGRPITLSELNLRIATEEEARQQHEDDSENPHGVTAEQVGLGSVDNTSDADKPISEQTQAAIDQLRTESEFGDAILNGQVQIERDERTMADSVLQQLIDALVNGATKAYLTYAALDADKANLPANSFARVTNDPDPANNWIWQWDGAILTKSDRDDLAVALAAVTDLSAIVNNLLKDAGLELDVIATDDGAYLLSVVDKVSQKLIFGVTREGNLSFGETLIKASDAFELVDSIGRSFFRYKDGISFISNLMIKTDDDAIVHFTDQSGKTLLRLSKAGRFYAADYVGLPSAEVDSTEINARIKRISAITRSGQWDVFDVVHIAVYGQSLSRGATSSPAISTTQPYANLMLAGGVLRRPIDAGYNASAAVPLIEQTDETPTSAAINGLSRRFVAKFNATSPVFFGSSTGHGGRTVAQLSKGGEGYYESTVQLIKDSKALFDSQGEKYCVAAYPYLQGENDAWGIPQSTYVQRLVQLKQDLDADVLEICTDQSFLPLMPMYQVAAHRHYGNNFMRIALAQLAMCKQYDDFVMAAPAYMMPHNIDLLHLTAEGSWLMGEYIARAMFYTMFNHEKWQPLQPAWVKWSGTTIVVGGWNARGTGLVIDDALCATTENSGFDLFLPDSTLVNTITNVALTDPTTITITLSAPAPNNAILCCGRGRDYMNGSGFGGSQTGARTNIRDNHGDFDTVTSPSGTTHALHNASVMWQYSRADGFNAL